MKAKIFAMFLLGFAACVGPAPGSDISDWVGDWTGTMTMPVPMLGDRSIPTTVTMATAPAITISPLCPDGTGSIVAEVDGNGASWWGWAECRLDDPPMDGCPATTIGYTHAVGTLTAGQVTLVADGNLSVCGQPHALQVTWQLERLR